MKFIQSLVDITVVLFASHGFVGQTEAATGLTSESYVSFTHVTSGIDGAIVDLAIDNVYVHEHCVFRCGLVSALSYYFVQDTYQCYCNNQTDQNTDPGYGTPDIIYGEMEEEVNTCQELYNAGYRTNGEYTIPSTGEPITCDFSALGWTVFQRRIDGSEDFYRPWNDYVAGFGNPAEEFWLGLDALHLATAGGCELHIYVENDYEPLPKGYAMYSTFSVGDSDSDYVFQSSGFSGNVTGDCMAWCNGMKFSTYDRDNDANSGKCTDSFQGGWWYKSCAQANLNGDYFGSGQSSVFWFNPWSTIYPQTRTEMAYRC